jgi:sugar (pentulose or hexulose) kinase
MGSGAKIKSGEAILGIELGSTRIKAVLIDSDGSPLARGSHGWENQQVDGIWTCSLDAVWSGLQEAFADLKESVQQEYGVCLPRVKSMGFSAMMHGYLVFDTEGELLVPFRTWRNTITETASRKLTNLFQYSIPQRWSIAHLYEAILNEESHVGQIAHMTTLAGYVHWRLTGRKVLGVGEASGMFPIDTERGRFNEVFIGKFNEAIAEHNLDWSLSEILPEVLPAGKPGGSLTEAGARLLDPSGSLEAGIPLCPPEGDAGTGMVATNSVSVRTGNVSAGTSVFAMLVLEKELAKLHAEIDLVTTPDGKLVAMVHSNNCTSDLNAWMRVIGEAAEALGAEVSPSELYERLLSKALEGDADCGGLLAYGYVSGEHLTGFSEGRPLFARRTGAKFTLANFVRAHLFSALCALRTGLNLLRDEEGVEVEEIRGHGGFFKTPRVGQRIMAAATGTPISVLSTAGEGGAWGIALLAAYMSEGTNDQSLSEFLKPIFADGMGTPVRATHEDLAGFESFFECYQRGLPIERAAVEAMS